MRPGDRRAPLALLSHAQRPSRSKPPNSVSDAGIAALVNVRKFVLNVDGESDIDGSGFEPLQHLRALDVHAMEFHTLPPTFFEHIGARLQSLLLNGCGNNFLEPGCLWPLTALSRADLHVIGDYVNEAVLEMPSVRSLALYICAAFTGEDVARLTRLGHLMVSDCEAFTGAGPTGLCALSSLSNLVVHGCPHFSHESFQHLNERCPILCTVEVRYTPDEDSFDPIAAESLLGDAWRFANEMPFTLKPDFCWSAHRPWRRLVRATPAGGTSSSAAPPQAGGSGAGAAVGAADTSQAGGGDTKRARTVE